MQGFPRGRIKLPDDVTERQLRLMIGNAFCVNVISMLVDRMCYAVGLTDKPVDFVAGTGDAGNEWPAPSPGEPRVHKAKGKAKTKSKSFKAKAKAKSDA